MDPHSNFDQFLNCIFSLFFLIFSLTTNSQKKYDKGGMRTWPLSTSSAYQLRGL